MNPRRFFAAVISIFLLAPISQGDDVPLSPADDAAMREVVQQYFDAYAAKDLKRWSDLWSPRSPHFAAWKARQQEINAETSDIVLKELTIVGVKVTSNVDFVDIDFQVRLTGLDIKTGQPYEPFGSKPMTRILELHRENEHWRVWSYYLPDDIDPRFVELSSIHSKQKRAEVLEAMMASLGEEPIPDGYTKEQGEKYVRAMHDATCANFLAMAYSLISDPDRRRQFLLEEPLLQSDRYPVRTLLMSSGAMFRPLESKLRFLRAAEEITLYQDDLKAILWCRQYRGMLLEQEGRLEEALDAFEQCKKMFPDEDPNPRFIPEWAALHFGSLVSAGRISMKLGHRQAALDDFDTADRFLKTAMQLGADQDNVATIPYIRQLQELQRIQDEELQPLFREGKFAAALQTAERIKEAEESVYGTVNKNVADTCQWMCEIQAELGQFEEALASIQHALETYKVYGVENPHVAWSQQHVRHLTELSEEQRERLSDARKLEAQETSSDEQAIAKWQAIYVIHRDILGADDDSTAYDLYIMGRYQFRQGNFVEGVNSWRQAAPVFHRTRGDDSKFVQDFYTDLADRLTTEARTDFELCKFEEGRLWQAEILRVYEKYHGPDHKLTVSARLFLDAFDRAIALSATEADQLKTAWEVLQQQRSMLTGTEQSPQAVRLATEALDTIGQLIGTQNVMHYSGRLMLTFAHMKFGKWAIAEQELQQEIDAPYCAPMPPAWQMANWLTMAKLLQGKLAEAERASTDAVRLTEQALGPMHLEYFATLSQRAVILRGLYQDDALRVIATQGLLLLNFKLLPPGHANFGSGLPVLDFDGLNVENKEYFHYYEEFLEHWWYGEFRNERYQAAARGAAALQDLTSRIDGEASTQFQDAMMKSCRVYLAIGRIDEAIKIYEQVLARFENLTEPTKDDLHKLMECCRMLAQCYSHEKRIAECERVYLQSMQLLFRLNYDQNPIFRYFYRNGFGYSLALDRQDEAFERATAFARFEDQVLNETLQQGAGETMRLLLAECEAHTLFQNLAINADDQHRAKFTEAAFLWTLRRQALVTETLCQLRTRERLLADDPEILELTQRLRELRQRASDLALNPPEGKIRVELTRELDSLNQGAEKLEAQLNAQVSVRSGSDVSRSASEELTIEAVQAKLPPRTSLVSYVKLVPVDYHSQQNLPTRYYAFVLTANEPVQFVEVGDAQEIDATLADYRRKVETSLRQLGRTAPEQLAIVERDWEGELNVLGRDLHDRLFSPIQPLTASADTLYIVPVSELNRLPFEALVDSNGKYVVESCRIAYFNAGRDLLRPETTLAQGTAVFDAADFDLAPEILDETTTTLIAQLPPVSQSSLRGSAPAELRGMSWKSLPHTRGEAEEIAETLTAPAYAPVEQFMGPQALEDVLKRLPAPRILHIATHGYFLPDEAQVADDGGNLNADIRFGQARGFAQIRKSSDPLIRSGLVLTGANAVGQRTDGDDGWLTAQEIALLNLSGTDLVVLSACESGLGEIKTGEGVQGLRVAFKYAGARTLICTLFQVPDEQTRDLMKQFYSRLQSGESKLDSLRAAQLAMIAKRRSLNHAAHPMFWSSFVLVGDPK